MGGPLRRLLRAGVALLVLWALFLPQPASLSAYPLTTGLPTVRLDYYCCGTASGPGSSLDPALASGNNLMLLVNANLVKVLPSDKPVPDLATWKISRDRKIYTFTIRRSARFANGHQVTAEDAAFSIRRALAPATNSPIALYFLALIQGADDYNAGKAKVLSGIKVLDRYHLRIRITKPAAYFLAVLAYSTADVLDPTVVRGKRIGNPNDGFKTNYLTNTCAANQGAGPFRFICRDRSSHPHSFYSGSRQQYTLVPNPYFYGPKPHVKIVLPRLIVRPDTPPTDLYKLYLTHKIDVSPLPPAYVNRWNGRSTQYHAFPSSLVYFLTPNVHLAPFDNVHCRLAVAYAVNRRVLVTVSQGPQRPSYAVLPQGMLGYYDGEDNPHYNLKRARAELARCPGRTIPVIYKYPRENLQAQAIGPMLRSAGMNVEDQPLSQQDWINVVSQPLHDTNTQLVFNGWQQSKPDPQDYCEELLDSRSDFAFGGWSNSGYNRLVEQADLVGNSKKRSQLYIQAQHIALTQGAWISLTQTLSPYLIQSYVHGLVGGPAYQRPVAKYLDWSKLSISKH